MRRTLLLFIFVLSSQLLFAQTPSAENILYVKKGATGDGSSWQNALGELADALKWAGQNKTSINATSPLQIWVANGTYKPLYSPGESDDFSANPIDPRNKTFLLQDYVSLYGGFNGTETNISDRVNLPSATNNGLTILSGDFNGNDVIGATPTVGAATITGNEENAYHVVIVANTGTETTYIDGFEITGGHANAVSSEIINSKSVSNQTGGAVTINASTVALSNLKISNNVSTNGGGVYMTYLPSFELTINNSAINNNLATNGGGITLSTAGVTPTLLLNNTVLRNNTSTNGGSLYTYGNISCSITLNNSSISHSAATENGGGIYASSNASSTNILLNRSIIKFNTANLGGGLYISAPTTQPELKANNSSISNNNAATLGSAIYFRTSYGAIILKNSSLISNTGDHFIYYQQGTSPKFNADNSIVFGNTFADVPSTMVSASSSISKTIRYSLVQGESATTDGNLDGTSPSYTLANLFKDAANGDFSLADNSPAKNRGSNTIYSGNGDLITDVDLAGNPRMFDHVIDLGAYENQTASTLPVNFGDFTAKVQSNRVRLAWNTFSETNNQSFTVLRSSDGVNFTAIAVVNSKGNGANQYATYDDQPNNGLNYYRLIQQDLDGTNTLLATAVVNFSLANASVKAWPNPVANTLHVSFEAGKYHGLRVLDVNGKVLQSHALTPTQNYATLYTDNYLKGVYIVDLLGSAANYRIKILK